MVSTIGTAKQTDGAVKISSPIPVFTGLDPHTGFKNSAEISAVRITG